MKMKKLACFVIAVLMLAASFALAGCGEDARSYDIYDTYNVYMPDGATALSLSYMMQFPTMNFYSEADAAQTDATQMKTANINYNVVPSATIASYAQSEKADIIVMPVNAGVNLYNKGAKYKIAAVLTHGNLFLIGKETGVGIESLKGKVIAAIGRGGIPELVLKYILASNGVEFEEGDTVVPGKAVLNFVDDGEYAVGQLQGEKADVALIAEPAATAAINKAALNVKELFDVQEEWGKLTGLSGYPQAALFVKDGLNSDFAAGFLRTLTFGNGWVEEKPAAAVAIAKSHALEGTEAKLPAVSAAVAIRCNMFAVTEGLKEYLDIFYDAVSLAPGVTVARPSNNAFYY